MADSGITVATPAGNVVVTTDEFPSGTHHERVKVQFGATGTATDVSPGAPLPVSDAALATALGNVLTELGQKLEPSDVASLATAAKQDTLKTAVDAITAKLTADPATQTSLAAVLAKLSSDPSTGTKQDTQAGKLDALKTSTDSVTTKLTADPSTATNQTANGGKLDTLHTDNGGPGSSQPALTNGGSGILGYLRTLLDTLKGTLTTDVSDRAARALGKVTAASIPQSLYSNTQTWANSAAVNTEKTVDIAASSTDLAARDILIVVRNPSAVTAVTVAVKNTYTDPNGGTTRYAKLTSFTAAVVGTSPDDGGESFLVSGALVSGGCRLSLKNATVLGGSDGFTASVQVYQL